MMMASYSIEGVYLIPGFFLSLLDSSDRSWDVEEAEA